MRILRWVELLDKPERLTKVNPSHCHLPGNFWFRLTQQVNLPAQHTRLCRTNAFERLFTYSTCLCSMPVGSKQLDDVLVLSEPLLL